MWMEKINCDKDGCNGVVCFQLGPSCATQPIHAVATCPACETVWDYYPPSGDRHYNMVLERT